MNVYELYRQRFSDHLDDIFIEQDGYAPITYRVADALAARMAGSLRARGLQPGARVAVRMDKSPILVCLLLACLRAGLVFVPLNRSAPPRECRRVLATTRPQLLVLPAGDAAALSGDTALTDDAALAGGATPGLWRLADDPDAVMAGLTDTGPGSPGKAAAIVDTADDAPALMIHTSGSTGTPKGVLWSHGFMAANGLAQCEQWGYRATDRLLHALPMHHSHGLSAAWNGILLSGGRLHLLSRFSADAVIDALPACTVFSGVPTMYIRLLESPRLNRQAVAHMRLFVCSSAALPDTVAEAFERRTGHTILECYGMTETGTLTSNPLAGPRRRGSVGTAFPGVTLRIADVDGRPLPAGAIGELQARKPRFADVLASPDGDGSAGAGLLTGDGYYRTGDLARIDADGAVRIVGRQKDVIVSGGSNIHPKEIETALSRIPGVGQCAVFGVPHPALGEAPIALVVRTDPALSSESIRARAAEELAPYKLPRQIHLVDRIALNAIGKTDTPALRERYRQAFA